MVMVMERVTVVPNGTEPKSIDGGFAANTGVPVPVIVNVTELSAGTAKSDSMSVTWPVVVGGFCFCCA